LIFESAFIVTGVEWWQETGKRHMQIRYYLAASAAALSLATVMMAAPAMAQQITSGIQGTVKDASGVPLNGATVIAVDTRTGSSRSVTTDSSGNFAFNSLVTGGPYSVTANADGFEGQTVENININLQGNTAFRFSLAADATDSVIVVSGSRANVSQLAIGPGQSFGAEVLETFPTITRDIRDFIRIDPRVSLDRANEVDRISCLGGNDRSNTFSVDGIIQSDVFGLNGTPFASRNSLPLPFDVIAETSVEFAPFDVQYGAFTGCAINVVTKAGQNDFHGSAFGTFTSDSLTGDSIDGVPFNAAPFDEYRWGATLSGPIIKDKLFFSFGYEETDLGNVQDDGPIGSGFPNELAFVTEAQFNEISSVLSDTFGIETGGLARTLPETNRRFFGRIDWYINDRHRFEATYQRLEEQRVEPDDLTTTNFTGLNTFEIEGTESNYYSARLYSSWTDNFSTEIRASYSDVLDVQGPVGGGEAQSDNPIPRIIVGVTNNGLNGSVQAGPGFSRTSNELQTEIGQLRLLANLVQGDHSLTAGVDLNQLDVFNLFAQNSTGTLTFANVAALREGLASTGNIIFPNPAQIVGGLAAGAVGNFTATGDINTAAASFRRLNIAFYAQDKWQVTPQLQVLAGARIEFTDGDAPRANPAFAARTGFSNRIPFSNLDPVLLPRVGFTYNFENQGFFSGTQLKGGVGIFTGGDPTVFFSNAFSNNGFSTGQGQTGVATCFPVGAPVDVVTGGQFTGIPACVRANAGIQSALGLADTQSTDPNLQTPTVVRANLGVSTFLGGESGGFFSGWRLNLDYIYSRFRNPIDFVDLSQVVDTRLGLNGFTIDGRPIFRAIDPTVAGCSAQLQNQGGRPPTFTNVTPACFSTSRDDEIQVTNGRDHESHVASVVLSKSFDRGLLTDGGGVFVNFGYAFTDSQNNRFNNSATATSSFDLTAAFNRQDSAVATSEFETRHNITASVNFREQFFGEFNTQVGLIFVAREGRPFSATFDNGAVFNDFASGQDNALLYVPTGLTDPNVVYSNFVVGGVIRQTAAQAAAGLDAYINDNECISRFRGQSIVRNSCRNDWFYDLDMRISQELPGPGSIFGLDDKIQIFADFDNLLNLIDDGANVFRRRNFTTPVITTAVDAQGRYVLSNFLPDDQNFVQTSASLWRIQFGVRYQF